MTDKKTRNDKNPITFWSEEWEDECMMIRYDDKPNPEFRERKCLEREKDNWKIIEAMERTIPRKESGSNKESDFEFGNDYQNVNIYTENEDMEAIGKNDEIAVDNKSNVIDKADTEDFPESSRVVGAENQQSNVMHETNNDDGNIPPLDYRNEYDDVDKNFPKNMYENEYQSGLNVENFNDVEGDSSPDAFLTMSWCVW